MAVHAREASRAVLRNAVGVVSGLAAGLWAASAPALTIRPTFDASVTSLSNASTIEAAFNYVALQYDSRITNPATINIDVSWGSVDNQALPSTAVGASVDPLYGYFNYAQINAVLTNVSQANPSDSALASAVKNLPKTPPAGASRYVIPSAELKALGYNGSSTAFDGYIGFAGSTSGYTYFTSSAPGSVVAGTYDFDAVAAHEIDEVLGRTTGIYSNSTPYYRTVFDLFRYSSPGVLNDTYTSSAYFSIDGGKTNLGTFNNSASGGDRSDWQTNASANDIQDAFICYGGQSNSVCPRSSLYLTDADLTGLDVLGYANTVGGNKSAFPVGATAVGLIDEVPEPSAWALMVIGVALLGARARVAPRLGRSAI
jgi:hypothetical protein